MNTETREKAIYPVGERIKFFRCQKGISTNKLANMSGISQSYLRDIELGVKNPTVEIVYLLCQSLDISLKEFFAEEHTLDFTDDPLIQRIYQLSAEQRRTLLEFLNTIS